MSEQNKVYPTRVQCPIFLIGIVLTVSVAFLVFGAPSVFAGGTLKVGVYGGYFKDSFDKHIFPDFTLKSGT